MVASAEQRCIGMKHILEKRKFYQILPDEKAAQEGYLRVVDESQEDYLYPDFYFIFVELPHKAHEALGGNKLSVLYLSKLP